MARRAERARGWSWFRMAKLEIKYRTEGKALPPRPIRVSLPGWGGSPDLKKENGSQPQPWHCPLHVEGATSGF